MSQSIAISYVLHPPSEMQSETISHAGQPVLIKADILFPIATDSHGHTNTSGFYQQASITLRDAQRTLNEILTAWKDAIGDKEKTKEDLGKVTPGMGRATRMTAGVDVHGKSINGGGTTNGGEEELSDEEEMD